MSTAVCDSGPLTHLWQIGMWSTFGTFTELDFATPVAQEVEDHVQLEDLPEISGCSVCVHDVAQEKVDSVLKNAQLERHLEVADLATLILADELNPDFVLTDDLTLRRELESRTRVPMGSVGILLRAYSRGLMDAESLGRAIDRLFVHSTLYLSRVLKGYVRELIADKERERKTLRERLIEGYRVSAEADQRLVEEWRSVEEEAARRCDSGARGSGG